jgi:diphthamide biosynthesis protein 4
MSHYSVLGVSAGAPVEDIRAAYHAAVLKCHPDKHVIEASAERPDAQARFLRIQQAWEVLRDAELRRAYDVSIMQFSTKAGRIVEDVELDEMDTDGFHCRCGGVAAPDLSRELPQQLIECSGCSLRYRLVGAPGSGGGSVSMKQ